jgi:hypothetical protein
MSLAANELKELHQLHIQLASVEEKMDRGPRQVRAREQFAQKKQAELEEQQNKLKQLRMAADQKGLQLKSKEAKIAELRSKLNQATSNREYDIIRSQIDADTMANSVLEDEILEALEKVDQMQIAVKKVEAELAAAKAEAKRIGAEVSDSEPGLRRAIEDLQGRLREAESRLPGTILEVYRRLVQAHGATALAAVQNNACTACHSILSPQEQVNVRTEKTVFCRSCGRLLYRAEGE